MDNEKLYKEALEKAREYKKRGYMMINAVLDNIFPELKESEDERIRNILIGWVNLEPSTSFDGGFSREEIIAWLEKQGEHKSVDKVEPKFNVGEWIVWQDKCYRVNYNGCGYELVDQNGLTTSCEYGTIDENAHLWDITKDARVGDVLASEFCDSIILFKGITVNGNVDFYCDYDFSEIELINVKGDRFEVNNGQHYGSVEDSEDFHPATKEQRDILMRAMTIEGYTFNFKKKELKKIHVIDEGKAEMDYCFTKMMNGEKVSSTCSKEDEEELSKIKQNSTDNVKPKFEVGDFIKYSKANVIYKVISVNSGSYYVENIETGGRIEYFDAEQDFRLWTIEDAKEGDVLATKDAVFIFKHIDKKRLSLCKSYCQVIGNSALGFGFDFSINSIYPATKDQRDTLFAKMKEAGYEWDNDKKELKKIKSKFKGGDYIIHQGTGNIYQVISCIDNQYQLKYGDTYTIQKCDDVDRHARLLDVPKDVR